VLREQLFDGEDEDLASVAIKAVGLLAPILCRAQLTGLRCRRRSIHLCFGPLHRCGRQQPTKRRRRGK